MATLKDLAREAGVSLGTASNVINAKPQVSAANREKVEAAIERIGYKVNLHARGMILGRSFNIGIIVPSLTELFYPKLSDGIEKKCEEKGLNVLLASSRNDARRESKIIESYLSRNVDGMIITLTSDTNREQVERLVERNYPLVLLGRYFNDLCSHFVVIDNTKVSHDAVEYLLACGHRKIYFLTLDFKLSSDRERREGFSKATASFGLDGCRTIVYAGELTETHRFEVQAQAGYEMTRDLLRRNDLPSALFASNDYVAMGCMRACHEARVAIPEEVSLIGAGNMLAPELQVQRLTTFDPHAGMMGQIAAELMCALIESGDREAAAERRGRILEMDLVEGETVRKIRE